MEWKSFPKEAPTIGGNYIASIRRQMSNGQYIFSDLAFYDFDAKKWYKYDPFDDHFKPTEDITGLVVGWVSNMGTFLGSR